MSNFARTTLVIVFLALLAMTRGLFAVAAPDDLASVLRLEGIPGPYSFQRFCRLRSGDMWTVGGDGEVQFFSG
jgi:hypothetical protein